MNPEDATKVARRVLEHLRYICGRVDRIDERLGDLTLRVQGGEARLSAIHRDRAGPRGYTSEQQARRQRSSAVNSEETTKVESLVLEHLRYIRGRVDRIDERLGDLTLRVQRVEERLSAIHRDMAGLHEDYAALASRVDRWGERTERMEKRLDLTS